MALCVCGNATADKYTELVKAACAVLDMAAFNPGDPLFPWMPEFCHEMDSARLY